MVKQGKEPGVSRRDETWEKELDARKQEVNKRGENPRRVGSTLWVEKMGSVSGNRLFGCALYPAPCYAGGTRELRAAAGSALAGSPGLAKPYV